MEVNKIAFQSEADHPGTCISQWIFSRSRDSKVTALQTRDVI